MTMRNEDIWLRERIEMHHDKQPPAQHLRVSLWLFVQGDEDIEEGYCSG